MTVLDAILLGLLQGATEFLPVSSTGHLVVVQHVFGIDEPETGFLTALHFGTLMAVVLVFRRDLWRLACDGLAGLALRLKGADAAAVARRAPQYRTAMAIVVGTIPAAVLGLALKDAIDSALKNLTATGGCLTVTGLLLLASRWAREGDERSVAPGKGFLVGLAQAVALLPGISRSGSTIVAARFLGISRESAGRFSFLLAVPVIAGGAVWEARKLVGGAELGAPALAVALGIVTAMLVGVLALMLLMGLIRRGRLHWFAAYCIPLGIGVTLYGLTGH